MGHPSQVNIGAFIHASTLLLPPAEQAAGTRNGSPVDIGAFRSGVIQVFTGATSGTPTSFSVTYKLQSRTNDGTTPGDWVDATDPDGAKYEVTVAAANSIKEMDVNFTHLEDLHTDVRLVETTALADGSTPKVITGAALVRGGSNRHPV